MKKELLKGFTMVMLLVVLALASAVANAQSSNQSSKKIVADVPFEFSVGYKTMPAGMYSVQIVLSAGNGLLIQNADATVSVVRLTEAIDRMKDKTHARLIFHRYGERYFLAEVWNGTDTSGRRVFKSLEESAIERELASTASTSDESQATYQIVEVLAMLR
jgi:hypothetical protein